MTFTNGFDNPQQPGMLDEKGHQGALVTPLHSPTEMIKSSKGHLHRDPVQRLAQGLGDLLADIGQDGVKDPRRVQLDLDPTGAPHPQIGQPQQALGYQERLFNPPTTSIEGADLLGRQPGRVQITHKTNDVKN